ncbi:SWI/SNF chromatin-remodeling complex subunit sol1 [Wickerhamiella sorbophila]|uniref:SWI/SNF chromatin-remodeling complex subunit sol1 n=1 Tax=Wickerhamiella sorbophila TaxID=45607 RepID=A0A2T0FCY0_9ASCO|nr:SWI/SNF chromatin-remodeling complex subunit sol1 [Wickerhamiella sorbophila]PRT52862.1 SWI/SNF chromatin-remodeling complex subunit sol1 [Wickerhamiella sorbophila]
MSGEFESPYFDADFTSGLGDGTDADLVFLDVDLAGDQRGKPDLSGAFDPDARWDPGLGSQDFANAPAAARTAHASPMPPQLGEISVTDPSKPHSGTPQVPHMTPHMPNMPVPGKHNGFDNSPMIPGSPHMQMGMMPGQPLQPGQPPQHQLHQPYGDQAPPRSMPGQNAGQAQNTRGPQGGPQGSQLPQQAQGPQRTPGPQGMGIQGQTPGPGGQQGPGSPQGHPMMQQAPPPRQQTVSRQRMHPGRIQLPRQDMSQAFNMPQGIPGQPMPMNHGMNQNQYGMPGSDMPMSNGRMGQQPPRRLISPVSPKSEMALRGMPSQPQQPPQPSQQQQSRMGWQPQQPMQQQPPKQVQQAQMRARPRQGVPPGMAQSPVQQNSVPGPGGPQMTLAGYMSQNWRAPHPDGTPQSPDPATAAAAAARGQMDTRAQLAHAQQLRQRQLARAAQAQGGQDSLGGMVPPQNVGQAAAVRRLQGQVSAGVPGGPVGGLTNVGGVVTATPMGHPGMPPPLKRRRVRQPNPKAAAEAVRMSLLAVYMLLSSNEDTEIDARALLAKVDEVPAQKRSPLLAHALGKVGVPTPGSVRFPYREIPPELFSYVLGKFMETQTNGAAGRPVVDGRRINLYVLFVSVQACGGFTGTSKRLKWLKIANHLQVPLTTRNVIALINIYVKLLLPFELAYMESAAFRQRLLITTTVVRSHMRRGQDIGPGRRQADMFAAIRTLRLRARAQALARARGHPIPPLFPPHILGRVRPNGVPPSNSDPNSRGDVTGASAGWRTRARIAKAMREMNLHPRYGKQKGAVENGGNGDRRLYDRDKLFEVDVKDDAYIPHVKQRTRYGGRDLRSLVLLGTEIENWRPDVAFPFDLATVDLRAIKMSLASRDVAEVRQALDKLIVVTTDPHVHISLQHCPFLLANLCEVVQLILEPLLGDRSKINKPHRGVMSVDAPTDDEQIWSVGDRIFSSLKLREAKREDIVVSVSSTTGSELEPVTVHVEGVSETIETAKRWHKHDKDVAAKKAENLLQSQRIRAEHVAAASVRKGLEAEKAGKPMPAFGFVNYTKRYERIEEELQSLQPHQDEQNEFFVGAACSRLLAATCVLRNLSFAEPNRPLIARKPNFQSLLWSLLYALAENPCLLDHEIRTLDLCKDLLVLLSNISLHWILTDPKHTLVLILFLLSFSVQESPYTSEGDVEFAECDMEVHRSIGNAVDVFCKLTARASNREIIEAVLRDTITDPDYRVLIKRYLNGRPHLEPCEFLTKMFSLAVSVMPSSRFRPAAREMDSRRPFLLLSALSADTLVSMIPNDEDQPDDAPTPWRGVNIAAQWLASRDHFGNRLLRAINFMAMVVISANPQSVPRQPGMPPQPGMPDPSRPQNGPENMEQMRPFQLVTRHGVDILQTLYRKARMSMPMYSLGVFPTVEHLLGNMMAGEMEKNVVRLLSTLYDDSILYTAANMGAKRKQSD